MSLGRNVSVAYLSYLRGRGHNRFIIYWITDQNQDCNFTAAWTFFFLPLFYKHKIPLFPLVQCYPKVVSPLLTATYVNCFHFAKVIMRFVCLKLIPLIFASWWRASGLPPLTKRLWLHAAQTKGNILASSISISNSYIHVHELIFVLNALSRCRFTRSFVLHCVEERGVPEPQRLPDGLILQVAVEEVLVRTPSAWIRRCKQKMDPCITIIHSMKLRLAVTLLLLGLLV
jgi:hypothetical protein